MKEALETARTGNSCGEIPVGAIVVFDNRIIGKGHNRQLLDSDPTAHAEIVALREAAAELGNFRLDGAKMYVTVKPCLMCREAIKRARLKKVFYASPAAREATHKSEYENLKEFSAECAGILKGFFKKRRWND